MTMELKLIGKKTRLGYPNSNAWLYVITDNSRQREFWISEPPFPPNLERSESLRELSEITDPAAVHLIYGQEIATGLAIRHSPNEIALEHYKGYKWNEFRKNKEETGLVDAEYPNDEEELRRLKSEMDVKRQEIIREETLQSSLEVIRDLFEEEEIPTTTNHTNIINNTTINNNFRSNCSTRKFFGFLVLLVSFGGLLVFLVKKCRGKKINPSSKLKF